MTDAVLQSLGVVCSEAPVEIRVLCGQRMISRRFDNHHAAVEWANSYSQAYAIYVLMNPFDERLVTGAAVNDEAITRRRWLLIDFDPKRDPHTNSTDAELAKARDLAVVVRDYLTNEEGFSLPIECESGNGYHLLYRIDLPNDAESLAAVKRVLKYLDRFFSTADVQIDLSVANASRITKLYGTWVRKGPHTPERPHRLSAITHVPQPLQQVPAHVVLKVANYWREEVPYPAESDHTENPIDRETRVEMARSWASVQPPAIQGENGNDRTYSVCCGVAVDHDLSADNAFRALQEWNARCQPPWSPAELREAIRNAIKYAKGVRGSRLIPFPHTEAGDAERWADLFSQRVRYDHLQGRYLVRNEVSGIWVPDPTEQLNQMTVELMRVRQRESLALKGDIKKKALTHAIAGESVKRIRNTLTLARSVPPIADTGDNWDQNPFLLGTQNGVVDLQTGQFRKATATDRVTMRVRVAYDANATCPLWLATLRSTFANGTVFDDAESRNVVDFMQRAIGYTITGDCREECCFFTWGGGSNGKGTIMNTLGWLLGDYTDDIPTATLERPAHGGGIPNDVAKLAGKRFITCAEVNEFTINEARLKALTGRDPITARFLRREWFTFIPVGKMWIATNNKPKIAGTDDGIWRRIHLIPFLQNFQETGTLNMKLKDQLRDELPGILNWAIAGTRMWLAEGLNPPEIVKSATAAYRHESNPVTPFIEACCVRDVNSRMQPSQAFKVYETFCRDTNVEPWRRLSDKAFYKAMDQCFKKIEDRTRQLSYVGVGLNQCESGRETSCDDVT